jgi:aminoglycoside 3-N-acetyltransferase
LVEALRSVGVEEGDTIMLHSAFRESNGFRGTPADVADAFLTALGEAGNLIMVSLPTTGASHEYLSRLSVFDVRKVPSRMGLVSEFFRRREGVLRSLHPSHPMLAFGPRAHWIVEGHDQCLYPCGPGTPFDKAVELDGKIVFFDTGLGKMTFFHWLEHRIRDRLEVPLYQEEPFTIPVIDRDGNGGLVRTYAFSQEIIDRRRDFILHDEMFKAGIVRRGGVGNTSLLAVRLRDVIRCVDDMVSRGVFFHEVTGRQAS